jgi:hypothetical protein
MRAHRLLWSGQCCPRQSSPHACALALAGPAGAQVCQPPAPSGSRHLPQQLLHPAQRIHSSLTPRSWIASTENSLAEKPSANTNSVREPSGTRDSELPVIISSSHHTIAQVASFSEWQDTLQCRRREFARFQEHTQRTLCRRRGSWRRCSWRSPASRRRRSVPAGATCPADVVLFCAASSSSSCTGSASAAGTTSAFFCFSFAPAHASHAMIGLLRSAVTIGTRPAISHEPMRPAPRPRAGSAHGAGTTSDSFCFSFAPAQRICLST